MKLTYFMKMKEGESIQVDQPLSPIIIDGIIVVWNINASMELVNIYLVATKLPIRISNDGYIISSSYPDVEEKIYRVALFIANQFYIQTGLDIIDYDSIFRSSAEVLPETEEEKDIYRKTNKKMSASIEIYSEVVGHFNPKEYDNDFQYSDAIANYTEGLRAVNVLQKFEQFYKVIEHFFDGTGKKFDMEVSQYVRTFNTNFTEDKIETLRILRNRCIHPQAYRGHINPENMSLVKLVYSEIESIKELAYELIKNPRKIS